MRRFSVRLSGIEAFKKSVHAYEQKVERGVRQAVFQHTEATAERARAKMREPKSGLLYWRHGRWHQASAPGEAPAIDTEKLYNSIRTRYLRSGLTGEVYTTDPVGAWLENGTQHILPRPWLGPSFQEEATRFIPTIIKLTK